MSESTSGESLNISFKRGSNICGPCGLSGRAEEEMGTLSVEHRKSSSEAMSESESGESLNMSCKIGYKICGP